MRPASSHAVTVSISVLCLLAVLFSLNGLSSAQAAAGSQRKLSQHSLLSPDPVLSVTAARRATPTAPPPLTADSWTGTAGDNLWSDAGNWSNGVPTSTSAVTIGIATANVTMDTINGAFGTLTLSGSGDTLTILDTNVLTASGNISNAGTITLNSTGDPTELVLGANVTLSGAGTVTMSNNVNNLIFGAATTDTLTNQQTIQGAGNVGNGQMTLVNSGTINANQSAGLIIQANGGTTNTGTLEATAGSTLTLLGMTVTNTGGTISANGSTLNLTATTVNGGAVTLTGASSLLMSNSTIHGGSTLTNSATGTIEVANGTNTLGGTINNSAGGTFKIDNGAILNLEAGTYSQLGTVQLNSTGVFTELGTIGNVTLSGGTVTLSNNANNVIQGSTTTDTLTNQETIQGAGNIGNGQMTLVNSGTINANQSAGLIIQANGGTTNTGTLEATAGSTLTLLGMTVTNTGGTISANGSTLNLTATTVNGGAVTLTGASSLLLNNSTIHGGSTLTNSATGTIEVANGTNTLGGTINNSAGGTLKIDSGATLNLEAGTYSQLGTVQLNASATTGTELLIGTAGTQNVTLSGGTVMLSNSANNVIQGFATTDTLTNQGTIQGAGNIGNGQMTLVNSGTINANQTAGMTIQANGGTTNTGTIEATAGSTLLLNRTTVTNAGGTISDNGSTLNMSVTTINGGAVTLTGAATLQMNDSTIHGGTLTNSATGTIIVAFNTNTLGGTINNSAGGTIQIHNSASLSLEAGTYAQLGNVQLNSTGNNTELVIGTAAKQNVTLSGGTITLSNNANNFIQGASPTDTLTNLDTIQGAGNIGNNNLALVNSGTINANASSNLIIGVSTGGLRNVGTLEATGGTLSITGPGTTFFTNYNPTTNTLTGGTYIANGNNIQWSGTNVGITTLAANVTEENGGQLFNTGTSTNFLAGLTSITSAGSLTIGGVAAFVDAGNFSNAGSLTILSGQSFTVGTLTQINGTGSLTAGTYVLDANLNLSGATQNITTNAANLTLAGGTIENANSTDALAGLATNTGTLTIGGTGNNLSTTAASFSNTGTLTINAGDSYTAAALTQISGSTLSGGTFVLAGNLDLTTAGINITTNSSTLTLSGGTINSNGVNALIALASNTKSLTIAGTGNNISTSAASFSNTGTLTINSGDSFTTTTLTQLTGTTNIKTLSAGTYVLAGNLDLTTSGLSITKNAATLTLEGGTINSNGVNALSALASNTRTLTIAGTGTNISTSAASFNNTGTLNIGTGDSFTAPALTQISGSTLTAGVYILGGNLNLTGAANITTNSANLTLQGGTIQTGATNDLANLSSNTKNLTLAGNANFSTGANFTNTGAVVVSHGSTFTVTGTGNSYNQSAGTTTADGTLVGSGTTGISVTGGTIQGAGTLNANVSIGGGGATPTINVGDAGKAGLLKITGTYTQLSTGTMNVSIGGTTLGTKFSQLQITGAASLAGTVTAALVNGFTPTVGQTFTILTASSVTGTFTNSTIAINGSEHFIVSYTATSVVLTVASGAAKTSSTAVIASPVALASTTHDGVMPKAPAAVNGLRHKIGVPVKLGKPILVAGLNRDGGRSNAIAGRAWERNDLQIPHAEAVVSLWNGTPERPTQVSRTTSNSTMRLTLPARNNWVAKNGVRVSSTSGVIGLSTHRTAMPTSMLPMHVPVMATAR